MDGRNRSDVTPGTRVQVVQKQDQRSGKLTEGTVYEILTNSATHPHGIKVRLGGGIVGRVKVIGGDSITLFVEGFACRGGNHMYIMACSVQLARQRPGDFFSAADPLRGNVITENHDAQRCRCLHAS